jgi:hypothetical protein
MRGSVRIKPRRLVLHSGNDSALVSCPSRYPFPALRCRRENRIVAIDLILIRQPATLSGVGLYKCMSSVALLSTSTPCELTLQLSRRGDDIRHEDDESKRKAYASCDIIAVTLHDTFPSSSRTQGISLLRNALHTCKTLTLVRY